MTRRLLSPPAIACALTALALAVLALGPFMRETDQAWLLDGGMSIANGHPEIAREEFNFDKQFVSYYLPAGLFQFLPRPFAADTLVFAANVFGMVFFWGAMFWLLARSARRLPLALVLPVILTPAFLVYSPFYASAFTSAAFVILLAIFLDRGKWNGFCHAVVLVLAFLAVGARADAIFLLPLLAMLHSPRRTFASVLRSPNTWLMAAGGLLAFFLGRTLYLAKAIDYADIPFRLKPYLGYVAFGLGGAALLLLVTLHAIWRARQANGCKVWVAFLWLGLAMPMGYYSLQLLSPRHCTVGAISILVFVCARRGRAIFQNYFRRNFFGTAVKIILPLAALVPLILGLNLADIHHPQITCTQPTLLPSAAGVAPTGAYLAFAAGVRRCHGFLDHNHSVWAAAKNTRFAADAAGKVPYLFSPVESYLKFAIRLQNKIPDRQPLVEHGYPSQFYLESRSLMRFQFTFPAKNISMKNFLATTMLVPATRSDWHGITLLHGDATVPAADDSWGAPLWALNTAFGLEEFRLESVAPTQKIPADWAGKKMVLVSRGPFSVSEVEAGRPETVSSTKAGRWNMVEIHGLRAGEVLQVQAASPEKIFAGLGAFPEWMSLLK